MGPGGRCEPLTQSTPAVAVAVWVPDKGGSGLTPVSVFSHSHGGSNICQLPQAHHRVSQLPTQPPNRADESASSNSRTSPPRGGLEINPEMWEPDCPPPVLGCLGATGPPLGLTTRHNFAATISGEEGVGPAWHLPHGDSSFLGTWLPSSTTSDTEGHTVDMDPLPPLFRILAQLLITVQLWTTSSNSVPRLSGRANNTRLPGLFPEPEEIAFRKCSQSSECRVDPL